MTDQPMRIPLRTPNTVATDELDGMDDFDLAVANGEGPDLGIVAEWPDDVRAAARENWRGGPEAFDAWAASRP